MKHIIKVASLENLPNIRPLVAMNGSKQFRWYAASIPVPTPNYVDLGLPNGTLWATSNLGATDGVTPESWDGDYYAWGELTPKDNYLWETYKFGTENNLTKYNTIDNKLELDLEDDVVYQTYGGDWRIPTWTDYKFLIDNSTSELIPNYNGVEGLTVRRFTSKINGNSIVFRANGKYRSGTDYNAGNPYLMNRIPYETRTANCVLWLDQWGTVDYNSQNNRYYGVLIRPVKHVIS